MSAVEEGKWMVVVYPCGCAPYANFQPGSPQTKKDAAHEAGRLREMIADGAEVRHMTRDEALTQTNFMPGECPHDPQGWKRKKR